MFYREAGIFKTSYAADQALFRIPIDKAFVFGPLPSPFWSSRSLETTIGSAPF